MKKTSILFDNINIDVYSLNTVVVGSGAAGLNAADRLCSFGQKDIAIVTEGMNMGTSRNTGSDKQTYYKLTLSGKEKDSIYDMAQTLFDGGCMNGDIALVESALSPQCFYHLVDIGVPFPHNSFGEYVGYKTDHDPRQRATSAGPLTSRYMTEKLQEQVVQKSIAIFDGYRIIGILTDKERKNTIGLFALNINHLEKIDTRYTIFDCTNIIYATGAPAGLYSASVYPKSQTGSSGIAFEAGVLGKNLTESQYGIASTKLRWNLSGTYQQVLPRYISTDLNGNDEKEFLEEHFNDSSKMLNSIFLKGYQWPFDPRKTKNKGSSLVDILVYNETIIKKRKVFLDYTRNPSALCNEKGEVDFSILKKEVYDYLKNSNALLTNPIDRLLHMNKPAIDLYKRHGIDLSKHYLEIAVCAQHNNGGLSGNCWWESNIKHFFPIGEVNGSHGVYRPGGSALNSGQVGGYRAAQFTVKKYTATPMAVEKLIQEASDIIRSKINLTNSFLTNMGSTSNILDIRRRIGDRMTKCGAHIRSLSSVQDAIKDTLEEVENIKINTKISTIYNLPIAFQNYDLLVTQYVYLCAIENYILSGGHSRGSYIIYNKGGTLPVDTLDEIFRFSLEDKLTDTIQYVKYKNDRCIFNWEKVVPIIDSDTWFENVWNSYMKGEII